MLENVISLTSRDFEPKSDLIDCGVALVQNISHGNAVVVIDDKIELLLIV